MDGHPTEAASSGRMVVVVGPSGAGKDTLMAEAARFFAGREDILFTRRIITRDGAAGGEDHDGVSEAEFQALQEAGRLAVSWNAHGLFYGIPAETLEAVKAGKLVIANGSRSALGAFKAAYASLTVVNVVARPDVLAARLEARGRESRSDILRRLERSSLAVQGDYDVITIDNSGALAEAAEVIIKTLGDCLHAKV
jgi:ribose 1,5-bisphosphokinase